MNAHKSPPAVAQPAENKDAAEAKETEPKEAAPMPEVPAPTMRGEMGKMRPAVTQQFSTWNFIWLAIAAFIAYELGRGSEVARVSTSPPAETAPADMPQDTGT